jgi:glutamate 5-kinase
MLENRQALRAARRVVIKIGSRLLATRETLIAEVAAQVAEESARQFLIVSSGAISLGCQKLGYAARPKQMSKLQAAAAAGQSELMRRYSEALAPYGLNVAQVLLTHSDLASRRRVTNAQQALDELFEARAVPIVNENDTVSTDEIAFGDNDQLASMVAPLVGADVLLLLTDVSGVLDAEGNRISMMGLDRTFTQRASTNTHGTGGMASKVSAARKACHSGASVVIADAKEPGIISRVLAGEDVGTLFPPREQALRARQHWIAYTLRPRGAILINDGAAQALRSAGGSLLPVGIVGTRGQFTSGEAVQLLALDGTEVARGLTRLGVLDVARVAGRSKEDVANDGGEAETVVVHRDDMVLSD